MTEELQADKREVRQIYDPIAETPTSYLRDPEGAHPPLDYPPYKSTSLRHPKQPLVYLPQTITEITGPQLGAPEVGESDSDLTVQHAGEPIGERIIVSGRVFDTEGKPLRGTLVEIWQANAAGRYKHRWDRWPAPLDPNFSGRGTLRDRRRGPLSVHDDQAGPYPWGNHYNAWRPAHIHFSLLGRAFTQRLVTQMYFPGDPFFPYDPIFNSVRDREARAADDLELLDPRDRAELGPGVRVGHLPPRTRGDAVRGGALIFETTPSQTVGPYFAIGLPLDVGPFAVPDGTPGAVRISRHGLRRRRRCRFPTSCSRPGRPTPTGKFADMYDYGGASELEGFRGFARYGLRGWRRDVRHPDREARARCPVSTAPRRRPTSTCRCSPAACSTAASPGSTSPTSRRRTPADPVLARVPVERRATLLAEPHDAGYRFDIRLQGPDETVFFAV